MDSSQNGILMIIYFEMIIYNLSDDSIPCTGMKFRLLRQIFLMVPQRNVPQGFF